MSEKIPAGANRMIHSTTFMVVAVRAEKNFSIGAAFSPTVAMAEPKACGSIYDNDFRIDYQCWLLRNILYSRLQKQALALHPLVTLSFVKSKVFALLFN